MQFLLDSLFEIAGSGTESVGHLKTSGKGFAVKGARIPQTRHRLRRTAPPDGMPIRFGSLSGIKKLAASADIFPQDDSAQITPATNLKSLFLI